MAAYEKQGESDEWYTPSYIFDALGERFDLDVAAPSAGPRHVPARDWFWGDALNDALVLDWYGFVWMNPPFGHQSTKVRWLTKFFEHGNGIALLPDRTSAPWWQKFAPMADAVLFVAPKVKFEIPEGEIERVVEMHKSGMALTEIVSASRFSRSNVERILCGAEPTNALGTGTTLFAAGNRGKAALLRAQSLGQVFTPAARVVA